MRIDIATSTDHQLLLTKIRALTQNRAGSDEAGDSDLIEDALKFRIRALEMDKYQNRKAPWKSESPSAGAKRPSDYFTHNFRDDVLASGAFDRTKLMPTLNPSGEPLILSIDDDLKSAPHIENIQEFLDGQVASTPNSEELEEKVADQIAAYTERRDRFRKRSR